MAGAAKPKKFEEELADLEQIVGQIDTGELTLEESIAAFERGVALVRSLNRKLDEVERKVEVLIKTAQGELRTLPYEAGPSESADSESAQGGASPAAAENAGEDDDTPF